MGSMSILKIEEIYYKGFAEEMVNTITGFGLNIKTIKIESNQKELLDASLIQGPKQEQNYDSVGVKVLLLQ